MTRLKAERHLNVVCALACEAKPLIDLLQLRKTDRAPHARFCGDIDGRPVNVVVAGIGAENMMAAVRWLQELHSGSNSAWLNLGIAGHEDLDVGELVLVHSVKNAASERWRYPALVVDFEGTSRPLISYEKPCTDYPPSAMVDMEGDAFFSTAIKYCSSELAQGLKVISDNRAVGTENLTAQAISDLVFPHAAAVRQFAIDLFDLIPEPFLVPFSALGIDRLHMSVSHRHQIGQLHHKLTVLNAVDAELLRKLTKSSSAKQVLSIMRDRLNSLTPVLS